MGENGRGGTEGREGEGGGRGEGGGGGGGTNCCTDAQPESLHLIFPSVSPYSL